MPSRTITDANFAAFQQVSCDNHPIHYDVEYAKQTRFGKPLAHGLLLASLTVHFNLAVVVLEVCWGIIALIGLVKAVRARKAARP